MTRVHKRKRNLSHYMELGGRRLRAGGSGAIQGEYPWVASSISSDLSSSSWPFCRSSACA